MRNGLLVWLAILLIATWTAGELAAQTTTTLGTAQKLGPFTFHNLQGSDGTSTSGTSQHLGTFTTFDFQSSDGSSTSGSIQDLATTSSWGLSTTEPAASSDPFCSIWDDNSVPAQEVMGVDPTSIESCTYLYSRVREADGRQGLGVLTGVFSQWTLPTQ